MSRATPAKTKFAKEFARKVRAVMDERGWSVRDLADASGVGHTTIYGLIRHCQLPRAKTVAALTAALTTQPRILVAESAPLLPTDHTQSNQVITLVVASRIKREMDSRRISLRELARQTGEDPAIISRALKAKRCPSVPTLTRIAKSLNVSVDALVQ